MSGRCNCGKVEFEAPKPNGIAVCFCQCCRRGGGSIGSLNAAITVKDLKFTRGSLEQLSAYKDTETDSGQPMNRYFCGDCGSPIISVPKSGKSEMGFLKVSALDDPDAYAPQPNVFLFNDSRPVWAKEGSIQAPESCSVFSRGRTA